jgi:16S rRNA (cytidine1402-2'-O)-methyltransferase
MSGRSLSGAVALVGTPIGNLGDLTPGALAVLRQADVIGAEDTRRTRKLLSAYEIHPAQLVSIRAENEAAAIDRVLRWLDDGLLVALVSDAGMPAISDPGERLVRGVLDAGGAVGVEAGPDAATSALLISGLPRERWCFEGFLPRRGAARSERLAILAAETRTAVLYEAPHRLQRTLDDLAEHLGGTRPIVVANDLTKMYETTWRGSIDSVRSVLAGHTPRGEFVLVVAAAPEGAGPGK